MGVQISKHYFYLIFLPIYMECVLLYYYTWPWATLKVSQYQSQLTKTNVHRTCCSCWPLDHPEYIETLYLNCPMLKILWFLRLVNFYPGACTIYLNRDFRTPIHLSTKDLVLLWVLLYNISASVVGLRTGVITQVFAGYPLSPSSQSPSKSGAGAANLSLIPDISNMKASWVDPGQRATTSRMRRDASHTIWKLCFVS